MAKRARGTTRPGQRAPLPRSTAAARPPLAVPPLASPVAPRPETLTDEEAARAAEIEARLVAAERSAEEAARRQTSGRRRPVAETPVRAGSIAVRATQEYAYVARDVRRIALIGGSMIALLIAIWIVTQVTGIRI